MDWLAAVFVALALIVALAFRPWRLLANTGLISPLLAALVITPWLWALPWLHHMPLQLQLSGACLIGLALGWPLAVPVLCLAALAVGIIAPVTWRQQVDMALWLGIVPVTLSFLLGMALRRWGWRNLFVYILGRAFLGTALCMFIAGALAQWSGHSLAANVTPGLELVARWLIGWGDAFLTGMMAAICVAFRPHWLATWSDPLYIPQPPAGPERCRQGTPPSWF
ncbi:MAG: hypothetical protein FWG56_06085 [Desulfovibrionaceae bacterium]|nr:hypothetical protein [Desulfovibrionaceae bacterium]